MPESRLLNNHLQSKGPSTHKGTDLLSFLSPPIKYFQIQVDMAHRRTCCGFFVARFRHRICTFQVCELNIIIVWCFSMFCHSVTHVKYLLLHLRCRTRPLHNPASTLNLFLFQRRNCFEIVSIRPFLPVWSRILNDRGDIIVINSTLFHFFFLFFFVCHFKGENQGEHNLSTMLINVSFDLTGKIKFKIVCN